MTPREIVDKMMSNDRFSRWLGITVVEVTEGACRLHMVVSDEMLNGFGIAHGGITYSLADSALAFASNSQGKQSLSIETSISHIHSLKAGDGLIAEALCETDTEKLGHYRVNVRLEQEPEKVVALFKGIVYKTSRHW